jgi:REP element-mobilizing transposase RayT
MENHIHFIASAEDLSKELANFKSFTARKSIDYYIEKQLKFVLEQLEFYKLEHKRDRQYQFWQEGSHPERIMDREMMKQKIEYIHHNPVNRGYVEESVHWRYTSARNYAGMQGLLPVSEEW